jgi:ectoine hydroxylase-related dioxygenase (phytanoyl-CoA dioxygenase family)
MTKRLPPEHVARYERDGVLFPLPALTAEEVDRFRRACAEVVEALGPDPRPSQFSQWHLCFRWAHELATHDVILDAVEDLIGPDLLVHSSALFHKPARSSGYVAWHQDGHYWRLDAPRLTSAWIALTPSTRANGCLRVVPGSHARDRVPHREEPDADNLLGSGLRTSVAVDEAQAVDVTLAPGEMSVHHVNLIHSSRANGSAVPRIGFAVRYVAPGVRQARAHHRVVVARGRDPYGHFDKQEAPPGHSVADGLAAQAEILRWIRAQLTYVRLPPET